MPPVSRKTSTQPALAGLIQPARPHVGPFPGRTPETPLFRPFSASRLAEGCAGPLRVLSENSHQQGVAAVPTTYGFFLTAKALKFQ